MLHGRVQGGKVARQTRAPARSTTARGRACWRSAMPPHAPLVRTRQPAQQRCRTSAKQRSTGGRRGLAARAASSTWRRWLACRGHGWHAGAWAGGLAVGWWVAVCMRQSHRPGPADPLLDETVQTFFRPAAASHPATRQTRPHAGEARPDGTRQLQSRPQPLAEHPHPRLLQPLPPTCNTRARMAWRRHCRSALARRRRRRRRNLHFPESAVSLEHQQDIV